MSGAAGSGRLASPKASGGEAPEPITVRVPGALQMTGLSRTKLYALIAAGEIEIVKVGTATLIVVESIRAFVDRERCRATDR